VPAYFLIGGTIVAFVFLSQIFVEIFFGDNWLLPINVGLIFALQEVLRGLYQSKATLLIASGESRLVSKSSFFLIVGSILLMIVGINYLGLVGAPMTMVLIYSILIRVMNNRLKMA
jgi:O-antigen/teichoic acid export membrane protein